MGVNESELLNALAIWYWLIAGALLIPFYLSAVSLGNRVILSLLVGIAAAAIWPAFACFVFWVEHKERKGH